MLAVAEMYIKGVSTRQAKDVMREFGIESLSSTQVSRATKLLDDELAAWRGRPLGLMKYLSWMRAMKKPAMTALCAMLRCFVPSA